MKEFLGWIILFSTFGFILVDQLIKLDVIEF